jgi:hypothetical protein
MTWHENMKKINDTTRYKLRCALTWHWYDTPYNLNTKCEESLDHSHVYNKEVDNYS